MSRYLLDTNAASDAIYRRRGVPDRATRETATATSSAAP